MKHNFKNPSFIFFCVAFAFYLLLCFIHLSCAKVSGGTTHRVEGEAVVTVKLDIGICNGLPEDARQECILLILDILKKQETAS
jgi:hypothetical protein